MRLLVTGASGQLGGYLLRELAESGLAFVAWSGSRRGTIAGVTLQPVDLADAAGVAAAFHAARPQAIIHAGAMAGVAECFRAPHLARQVNSRGTELLAELAQQSHARFVHVSTDLVFDGEKGSYTERDAPAPLSVYGRTKLDAERAALAIPRAAVVRLSLLYGPTRVGRASFFDEQIAALRASRPLLLFEDEWRTPLDLVSAARALVAIARSDHAGLLHVGGPERMSRLDMGRRLAACLGADASVIVAASRASACTPEPRPRDTSLDSSRWRGLFAELPWPCLEDAVRNFALTG